MRPRRDTSSGRAYLGLQALARREGRPTQEFLVTYVLERFLYRLALGAEEFVPSLTDVAVTAISRPYMRRSTWCGGVVCHVPRTR